MISGVEGGTPSIAESKAQVAEFQKAMTATIRAVGYPAAADKSAITLLTRDVVPYLVDRYSERKESAEDLSRRVNQRTI